MDNFAASFATMLVALAFVLLLAWVSLRTWRRLQGGAGRARSPSTAPRFVSALPVGARERVVVVHHRGEEWVLGVTAGGISLLARTPLPPGDEHAQARG
jgi:flagellar protein FliO/FliZ